MIKKCKEIHTHLAFSAGAGQVQLITNIKVLSKSAYCLMLRSPLFYVYRIGFHCNRATKIQMLKGDILCILLKITSWEHDNNVNVKEHPLCFFDFYDL